MTKEMTLSEFVKEYGFEPYLKDNDYVRTALGSLEVWNRKKFTVLNVTDTSCNVCVNGVLYNVSCGVSHSHKKMLHNLGIRVTAYDADNVQEYWLDRLPEDMPPVVNWIAVLFKIRMSCENAMENAAKSLL